MYIKEQKAADISKYKDLIFKDVPIYIEAMEGDTIYPSQSVVNELRKCYNEFVGPNNHENTWDQFPEFHIIINKITPNSVETGAIKYMLTQKDKMKYLGKHVYMDIVLLKPRYWQTNIKNGVIRGIFNSIRFQNDKREIIVIDSDNDNETEIDILFETETEIDNKNVLFETKTEIDSDSDTSTIVFLPKKSETETEIDSDTESSLPQKKRKFIESDSESDDELPQKKPKIVNKFPDWLLQCIKFQENNEVTDCIYYGLVFIFLSHDELNKMSIEHKQRLIELLFKPNDITFASILTALYDIGKNYSFLQNVMKNQFALLNGDNYHMIKSNRFPIIKREDKELNTNYLKMYIDDRRGTKLYKKNLLDGMLYWLYDTYKVKESETYYFDKQENRIDLIQESESESEDEFVRSQKNDINFVLGVSQNIKSLLKGKGKNVELYNKMNTIVSKYHIQNLSSNNKEAKKQIIDCIFDQDMDMVIEYAYAKIQQEL